jgi:hypothetical protein
VFSKIIERIVKTRLLTFFSKNNYLSNNQFGFVAEKSTEDSLLKFCSGILNGLNKGLCTSGLFVDITKAFDSLDHNILLNRLREAGVRGVALKWFSSYLRGRTQCVRLKGYYSDFEPITYGVPQGSVLGPILFLVYVNNLCTGHFNGDLTCYADDTALSYSVTDLTTLKRQMQNDLDKLKYWFTVNKLMLSEKTKYIRFCLRERKDYIGYLHYRCISCLATEESSCNNCLLINQVSNIKYLGLVIDENITWKVHINKLKNYMNMALKKFYYLRQICNLPVLKNVYYSLINSKLQYGLSCWGGTYITNLKPVYVAQKKIMRLVMSVRSNENSFPLFQKSGILPLRHLYVYRVLRIFFFRGGNTLSNINAPRHGLRLRNRVPVPKPNNEAYKRFYNYCAPTLFNLLPIQITSVKKIKQFLREVKAWLLSLDNIEGFFS